MYSELGSVLAPLRNQTITGRIDAANIQFPRIVRIEIKSYPTIYLFPATTKHAPFRYMGPRTVQMFVEFLQARGTWEY
jgi:hypothetical protein